MVSTGMIFQYDSTQGTGLIMLSDGEKKEFSAHQWADASGMPSVGLKIAYESDGQHVKIKMADEIEKPRNLPKEEIRQEEGITSFGSTEEFQSYFSAKGFDIVKKTEESSDGGLAMAKFTNEGVQTVSINFKTAKPDMTRKTIRLCGMDEHIQYFKETGYRLINDSDDDGSRKATLRRYAMDEHSEVIIKGNDEKILVIKTVNGKKVDLSK